MDEHRDLANPSGAIHFVFETVLSEAELNRRVRVITDLIYCLGGHLNDDRGDCVDLIATDVGTGTDWEGGGDEGAYTRSTGNRKADRKMTLEEVLEYFTPRADMEGWYRNRPEFAIMYTGDGWGQPFEITDIVLTKRGGVENVYSYEDEYGLKKRDFQDGQIEILHRIRPHT